MGGIAESASELIRADINALVDDALVRQWARWPELQASVPADAACKMAEDTRRHLDYLQSSLWFAEPLLFEDYAVWCKVLFANHSMPPEWFTGSVECIDGALYAALPVPEATLSHGYVEDALGTFREASIETTSFIVPGSALGVLARSYLNAALSGDRVEAIMMLEEAVRAGTPARDIYMEVFQPVQREVGRLWHLNQVSVAQEHWVTAVTQVAMARLSDHLFRDQAFGRTVVTACVGGEQHELGARMVSDLFEMDGWKTCYLGANTPCAAVVQAVRESGAEVLALSATITSHVYDVAKIIGLLRDDAELKSTRVLVGGYPFNVAPELWQSVGADGYASDAEGAPAVAASLMGN
jgi:methanogenic corrinoid protein MtbC1